MRLRVFVGLAALIVAGLSAAVSAQEITATITGTVTDPSGALIPGATVTVRNTGTGRTSDFLTSSEGLYTAALLPPGRYEVAFALSGFQTRTASTINLHVNDRLQLDMTLKPGGLSETVEVSAASQLIQPTAAVQNLMGSTQVQELPLNNRNFVELATLVAGVSSSLSDEVGIGLASTVSILHQRRAPQRRQLAARRRLQRGRRLRHHAALHPDAGIDRGVQDHHQLLRRGMAAQRRRPDQRRHEVGHERLPRQYLRVPAERRAQRELVLPQAGGLPGGRDLRDGSRQPSPPATTPPACATTTSGSRSAAPCARTSCSSSTRRSGAGSRGPRPRPAPPCPTLPG